MPYQTAIPLTILNSLHHSTNIKATRQKGQPVEKTFNLVAVNLTPLINIAV